MAGQHGGWHWTWETKSVNARSLDIRFRAPPGHDRLEMPVREAISRRFRRGSFNVNLTVYRTDADAVERPMRINRELLELLIEEARRYRERMSIDQPRIETLLTVRGVVEPIEAPEDEEAVEQRLAAMLASLMDALKSLAAARDEEGGRLKAMLETQIAELSALREQASSAEAMRPDKILARLQALLDELLQSQPALPEDRLAQEVALLVAKGDVREEIDRLGAHIDAAGEMIAKGGTIGRRLDFICQEMNREANTLCAKSGDVDLTRIGLSLKAAIEQFREQVQNVE